MCRITGRRFLSRLKAVAVKLLIVNLQHPRSLSTVKNTHTNCWISMLILAFPRFNRSETLVAHPGSVCQLLIGDKRLPMRISLGTERNVQT